MLCAINLPINAKQIPGTPRQRGRGIASISPDPDDNAGRGVRPKGEYRPGLLKDIKSVSDFAHALGVSVDSIKLVVPKKDVEVEWGIYLPKISDLTGIQLWAYIYI
jgi:hypothetical protein